MKGKILEYSIQANEGFISGDDGQRYKFSGGDWKSPETPQRGIEVDFAIDNGVAKSVFLAVGAEKKKKTGKKKMKPEGWVLFAVLVLFCIPLCWIPFTSDRFYEFEEE